MCGVILFKTFFWMGTSTCRMLWVCNQNLTRRFDAVSFSGRKKCFKIVRFLHGKKIKLYICSAIENCNLHGGCSSVG